jgi:hypothetical protein
MRWHLLRLAIDGKADGKARHDWPWSDIRVRAFCGRHCHGAR